jgi:hypothetical protein
MAYLALKIANFTLATIWSLTLTFVFIRVLRIDDFAVVAIITGLGGYVLAANMGFQSVVYARVRSHFLSASRDHGSEIAFTSLVAYAAIAIASVALVGGWIHVAGIGSADIRVALVAYFAGVACGLPWTIVRATTAATDRYRVFEIIELARRLSAICLVGLLYIGMDFSTYAWLGLLSWAAAFSLALPLMSGTWVRGLDSLGEGVRQIKADLSLVKSTALFSALESLIYNFPYIFVPVFQKSTAAVISFDTFYKISRFGSTAFLAPSEAFLPQQTSAAFRRDKAALWKWITFAALVGAIPLVVGVVSVTVFGDLVFGFLLADASLIGEPERIAMAIMLCAMLFQTIAGTLMLNLGMASTLLRVASCVVLAMLILSVVAAWGQWDIGAFLLGYACVYLAGAAAYVLLGIVKVRQLLGHPAIVTTGDLGV